ncbi:hypothetical protein HWV62_2838 [Athelia sp. TMB]|nr:hypothetical protein HWV62_2838 [Athelia sp. TMB]
MDSSGATPTLQVPRLRLSRLGQKYSDELDTPQAGPSRFSPGSRTPILNGHDDSENGDDAQSTPRMPMLTAVQSEPNSAAPTPIAETPSARLRALLSRVPRSPSPPRVEKPPPSEPDSDFDPPRSNVPNTPSIARESLKDLFSRALRDPGDTPQKTRRRRNSIDVSEVEASPRAERERARHRGQRPSLSDEEVDKSRMFMSLLFCAFTLNTAQDSVISSRNSQAATFEILRARLTNSQTQILNQSVPFGEAEFTPSVPDTSVENTDNESFLRGIEQAPASPVATSTPHRTMQIPSEIQFQSDLLEQDSDMRNAMKDSLSSFEGASRPVSFPPARPSQAPQSAPGRPLSHASGSKVHSMSRTPGVRPRAVSKTSIADVDHSDFNQKDTKEQAHLREREWGKRHPPPKTPESHRHSYSHESHSSGGPKGGSPMLNLTNRPARRDSITSLKSMDDNLSSCGSSVGSQADYRERIRELEKEKNIEREREWNKRHVASRPTSSMSMNSNSPHYERSRTQSQPMRPDSSLRYTPDHSHPSMYQRHSYHSPGSRASSRASSISSRGSSKELEMEIQHEVDHTRERNWNSPHPKWDPNDRAVSPSLRAESPRPPVRHAHSLSFRGPRPESPTAHLQNRPSLRSSLSYSSLSASSKDKELPQTESTSPQGDPPARSQLNSATRPRSHSHTKEIGDASPMTHASPANRFGWQFPRNKSQLPPLEFDEHSPERSDAAPSPSPSPVRANSRASAKASHIPVRAQRTPDVSRTMAVSHESSPRGLGHRRSVTELNESNGSIPPPDPAEIVASPQEDNAEDAMLTSDEDPPSPLKVEAAALQATETPEEEEVPMLFSPPVSPEAKKNDSSSLRNRRPPSPASDPPPLPEFTLSLATPPRPRSANSSRPEFQTPPTPAHLPALPEPPSEDESDAEWTPEPRAHLDFSTMKTPKPPGGWFTPIAPHREPLARASTLPDSDAFGGGSSSENGLATPLPSLSRATTLPFQTPAPPGAWVNTPGSERRKSIMKVRFDMESEQSASEVPNGHKALGDLDHLQIDSPSDLDLTPTIRPQPIPPSPDKITPEEVPTPVTPISTPPSSVRRSPIRVVDAFGREVKVEHDDIKPQLNGVSAVPLTPRSRSAVRIVDAMGREVEEKAEDESMDPTSDEELPSHNEALKRVRQSIADLASGLSDVDMSSNELTLDNMKMKELNGVSQAARDARRRLEETLAMARDVELELRKNMALNKIQAGIYSSSSSFSAARAKNMFLTTYYDPYYPELHLYVTNPDTIRLSMNHTARWSLSSVPGTLYHGGFKAVASDAWRGLAMAVYDWQQSIWETWGVPAPASWPPT